MQNLNESAPASAGWGGTRKGAGRKKTSAKSIGLRIPQDVADILDRVEGSKSDFIIAAIRAYANSSNI